MGKPLRGKLGLAADRMLDRLVGEGAFSGDVRYAKFALRAQRKGRSQACIVTLAPICPDGCNCVLRFEMRLLRPDERLPDLERVERFSWDDVDA